MPRIARLEAEPSYCTGVAVDDFVRCGPVGAVWQVFDRQDADDSVKFVLHPVDPHDVPLDESVVELPRPRRRAHA